MDQLIERRRLLLAAATGSLLLAGEVSAQDRSATNSGTNPIQPTDIPPPTMSADQERSAWTELKSKLKEHGYWSQTFETSLEASARDPLIEIGDKETADTTRYPSKLTHNPRLVEPLLGEIASLLDRCLAYRREAADLEIQGVSAGLARIQADALNEVDQQMLLATSTREVAAILAENYPKAATEFERAAVPIGAAQAIQANAQALTSGKIRDTEQQRIGLALGRLQFLQLLERQRLGRHEVSGNAHNFVERFERVRKHYISDLAAAYRRAIAASLGAYDLLGYMDPKYRVDKPWLADTSSLPKPNSKDFLDEFVIWTRDAMRGISLITENEIEFVQQLPFKAAVQPMTIEMSRAFLGARYVRLRSIAASYTVDKDDLNNPERTNASFRLAMERTNEPDQAAEIGPEETVYVPDVRLYSAQRSPEFFSGSSLYNLNCQGRWIVHLSKQGVTNSSAGLIARDSWLKGIVLHLRVAALIDRRGAEHRPTIPRLLGEST